MKTMKPKLKVWVMFGDTVKFGQGRAALLRLIDELGSIKQAVERFEMSYRNAWGYLRELEKAAGFRLLERQPGGGRASGTRLTPRGREFLEQYDRFERSLVESVARCFDRTFSPPQPLRPGVAGRRGGSVARSRGARKVARRGP
jgi:molybdate transport system regulatory protein